MMQKSTFGTEMFRDAGLCPYPGIDTCSEETANGLTDLHIVIRCKVPPGKAPIVRAIKAAGKRKQSNASGAVALTLKVQDKFCYNGELHEVKEILSGGRVKCCPGYDSDATAISLDHDEVFGLVKQSVESNKRTKSK